jgi:hypothetical protein
MAAIPGSTLRSRRAGRELTSNPDTNYAPNTASLVQTAGTGVATTTGQRIAERYIGHSAV